MGYKKAGIIRPDAAINARHLEGPARATGATVADAA